MSVFSVLTRKYTPSISYISPGLTNPVPPSANPKQLIQNGGPESLRLTLSLNRCPNISPNSLIPVLIEAVPASKTTAMNSANVTNYSQLNIQTLTVQQAQQIKFGNFFPPAVPPPAFLQWPRMRSNNEPYARQTPCVGPHRWDTS
jgi:hypothetical protein